LRLTDSGPLHIETASSEKRGSTPRRGIPAKGNITMVETPKTVDEKSKEELVESAIKFRSTLATAEQRYEKQDAEMIKDFKKELSILDWVIDEFRHTVGETDFRKW